MQAPAIVVGECLGGITRDAADPRAAATVSFHRVGLPVGFGGSTSRRSARKLASIDARASRSMLIAGCARAWPKRSFTTAPSLSIASPASRHRSQARRPSANSSRPAESSIVNSRSSRVPHYWAEGDRLLGRRSSFGFFRLLTRSPQYRVGLGRHARRPAPGISVGNWPLLGERRFGRGAGRMASQVFQHPPGHLLQWSPACFLRSMRLRRGSLP